MVQKDARGKTPLLSAVCANQVDVVLYLLDQGADFTVTTYFGSHQHANANALQCAIKVGSEALVDVFVQRGAFNISESQQEKMVHEAVTQGSWIITQTLLTHAPMTINAVDARGQTLLLRACILGHIQIVQGLLGRGVSMEQIPSHHRLYRQSPLHAAVFGGFSRITMILVQHQQRIFAQQTFLQSLLHALQGFPSWLDQKNHQGQSAIFLAIANGDLNLVEYLLQEGANPYQCIKKKGTEHHGKSTIEWAMEHGHDEIVRRLERMGLSMDGLCQQYWRVFVAVQQGHLAIVKRMVEKTPQLTVLRDELGYTCLHRAAQRGDAAMVSLLIQQRASIHTTVYHLNSEFHGCHALHLALSEHHYHVAHVLYQHQLATALPQDIPVIFSDLMVAEQAIELMLVDAGYIAILLDIERIRRMLIVWNGSSLQKSMDYYKIAGRRPSFFAHIDLSTQTTSIFKPQRVLGEGSYGKVRLFSSTGGEFLAVKSYFKATETGYKYARQEVALMTKVYPQRALAEAFFVQYPGNTQLRSVMPYRQGEILETFFAKQKSLCSMIEIILSVVKALQNVHARGVIHGDIKADNLLIFEKNYEYDSFFIDFGLAYSMADAWAPTFTPQRPVPYFAKERFNPRLKPAPSQDLFSFGYMLRKLLEEHELGKDLAHDFPSMTAFIEGALRVTPNTRPSLDRFADHLREEHRQNFFHLAASL